MRGVAMARGSTDWQRSSGRHTRELSLSSLSKEDATDTRMDDTSSLKSGHSGAEKEQCMSLDQSGKQLKGNNPSFVSHIFLLLLDN
jgi:hypothetical protein